MVDYVMIFQNLQLLIGNFCEVLKRLSYDTYLRARGVQQHLLNKMHVVVTAVTYITALPETNENHAF